MQVFTRIFGIFDFCNLKLLINNFLLVIYLGNKQHIQGKPMFNRIKWFFHKFFARETLGWPFLV